MSKELSGYPDELGWVPHHPETWDYRYAKLRNSIEMRHYTGRWEGNEPQFNTVSCPAGQTVKIVMVSRLGDIGITEDLSSDVGYGARVQLEDLYDFSNTPE